MLNILGAIPVIVVAIVEAVIPTTRMVSNQPVHRKFGKRYFPFSKISAVPSRSIVLNIRRLFSGENV